MFEKHFLVFCNVDEDGNIVDGLTGNNIIPSKQYDHFFYLGEEGIDDLMGYKVVDNKLVKRENAE